MTWTTTRRRSGDATVAWSHSVSKAAGAAPAVEPEVVDEWSFRYEGYDPDREGLREALCALGNGYFATRGAFPDAVADGVHYPGTYIAGLYDRRKTTIAGQQVENESVVNLPNWLFFTFRIDDGPWFHLDEVDILAFSQQLDLLHGVLTRTLRVRDRPGRVTRLEERRFVSMADPHVGAMEMVFTPENWSGKLTICSGLDARVANEGVARYRSFNDDHLVEVEAGSPDEDTISVAASTSQSRIRIAEAARTRFFRDAKPVEPQCRVVDEPGFVVHNFGLSVQAGEAITAEKVVTLFCSRDRGISEPLLAACSHLGNLPGFTSLLEAHAGDWEHLWIRFSLEVDDGGPLTRLVLHLHIFHLLQTVSRNTLDLDVGVPARGLHGEAYRGHVFWDELFILPYLNLHLPELVRSLLLYRYRRLPEARLAARQAGYQGAMYPWQSGSDGREEAQVVHLNPLSGRWLPDPSHRQRHINAAIAYNFWNYYQATGDIDFLATYGAEVILEVARFWGSFASYNPSLDRYEIRGVMGPDEYHDRYPGASAPGLDNNAYTNVMAVWVLSRALQVVDLLPEPRRSELLQTLELDDDILSHWDEVSRKMRVVFHSDGVISQFEGYEQLDELDWDAYRARYGDISRLDRILEAEGDTPNPYKASKQADVLMLFYLLSAEELAAIFTRLGYRFDPQDIPRTIDYYLARTSHGSTLSRVVHAWVLARSDREASWAFFEDALLADVEDTQGGTTAEGIHLGAMAGTVDLLHRCYLGIETREDVLWLNPRLPSEVQSLELMLRYHRRWLNIRVADGVLMVTAQDWGDGPVRIALDGQVSELHPGEPRTSPA